MKKEDLSIEGNKENSPEEKSPEGGKSYEEEKRKMLIEKLSNFLDELDVRIDYLRDAEISLDFESILDTFRSSDGSEFEELIKEILGESDFGVLKEIMDEEARREMQEDRIRFSPTVMKTIKQIFNEYPEDRAQKIIEYLQEEINRRKSRMVEGDKEN